MKKILQVSIALAGLFICGVKGYTQGAGNHFSMSMQNLLQKAPNVIQFDLYVVSDGADTSDLRANSFQYGINFNTGILKPGATIQASYVKGTSDFIPPLNEFKFPASGAAGHIRIEQQPYEGENTGKTMVIGHQYRVGTFLLTSSASWMGNSNPDFSLQSEPEEGKTVCTGSFWTGNETSTKNMSVPVDYIVK